MTLDLSHLLEVAEGAKALFKSGTLTNAPLRDTSDRVVGFRITPEIMLEEDWIFAAPIERVRGLRELALAFPALLARLQAAEEALRPFAKIVPSSFYPEDGSEAEVYTAVLWDGVALQDFTGADIARARAYFTPQPPSLPGRGEEP